MPTMNKEKLTKLIQAVQEYPEFNMRKYTTCILGISARLNGHPGATEKEVWDTGSSNMERDYGLTYAQVTDLTLRLPSASPTRRFLDLEEVTKDMAVDALIHLRDTGYVVYADPRD